jgi:acetoin utilization protein AcuB
MFVRDIMTRNVITVSGETYVLDAERIMESHRINRLPVVDEGRLTGIVTKDDVLKASPSSTSPFNQRQLFYLMSKLTVAEIMKKDVVTVTPDATVEKAVALAQKKRIGSLPVIEGDRLVGILTTNDVFYRILNPLLGIGQEGTRIMVYGAGERGESQKVMDTVMNEGYSVKTSWIPWNLEKADLVLHLETDDASGVMAKLVELGYRVELRDFRGE